MNTTTEVLAMSPSPKTRETRRQVVDRIRALLKSWPIKPTDLGWVSYKPPVIRVTSPGASQKTPSINVTVKGSEIFFRGQVHGGKLPTKADVFEGMARYLCEWLTPMAALVVLLRGVRGAVIDGAGLDYAAAIRRATPEEALALDAEATALIDKASTMSGVGSSLVDRGMLLRDPNAHEFLQRLAFLAMADATDEI
jgi:hypothetical protein